MRSLIVLVIAVLIVIPMSALATTVLPITAGTAGLYGSGGPRGINGSVSVSGPGFFFNGVGGPGFEQEFIPIFTGTTMAFTETETFNPNYDNGSTVFLNGVLFTKANNIPLQFFADMDGVFTTPGVDLSTLPLGDTVVTLPIHADLRASNLFSGTYEFVGDGLFVVDITNSRNVDYTWRQDSLTFFATPEPSTWLLLGSGLIGMMLWRKRTV